MTAEGDVAASVIPDIPYVRRRVGEQRATYFELFFDLVYVFAITQLSHALLAHLTWAGAAQAAFLLCAVYWAWNYTTWMTNWFDPEVTLVRVVLVAVMLASLLMAVAIPDAFGDHGLLFAASYCALQVGRNAFVVGVTPPGAFHRNFQQILGWSLLSVPLWIGGGVVHGSARWGLWLAAFGLDLAAPLVRFWLPRFGGGTPMIEWAIDAGHFAERFQLFVIIVLGESIVLTGATATDVGLEASVVVALGFAFLSSVALWWLYFGQVATAVRRMAAAKVPGQVGRDAYTYLHLPIVAGILLAAIGDEIVIAHPGDALGTPGALVTLGGPAQYLLGVVAFGERIGRHQPWTRPAAAALLLAAVPLAADAPGLLVTGLITALLIALVVGDRLGVGHPSLAD
jgi:low temperature requirement protein LtrA